jgi:nucleoside-triphosphatase THEP1
MYHLVGKLLSPEASRLLSVVGMPGIGKTALTKNAAHHIQERRILTGGFIFSNAQNIQDVEVYLK